MSGIFRSIDGEIHEHLLVGSMLALKENIRNLLFEGIEKDYISLPKDPTKYGGLVEFFLNITVFNISKNQENISYSGYEYMVEKEKGVLIKLSKKFVNLIKETKVLFTEYKWLENLQFSSYRSGVFLYSLIKNNFPKKLSLSFNESSLMFNIDANYNSFKMINDRVLVRVQKDFKDNGINLDWQIEKLTDKRYKELLITLTYESFKVPNTKSSALS